MDKRVVTKRVDEKINEGVLQWFGYVERMENDRFAKRVYVEECAGTRSVGRPAILPCLDSLISTTRYITSNNELIHIYLFTYSEFLIFLCRYWACSSPTIGSLAP